MRKEIKATKTNKKQVGSWIADGHQYEVVLWDGGKTLTAVDTLGGPADVEWVIANGVKQ